MAEQDKKMNNGAPQNAQRNDKNNKKPRMSFTWVYVIIAIALGYLFFAGDEGFQGSNGASKNVTYTVFKQYVENGYANKIVANKDEGTVKMYV